MNSITVLLNLEDLEIIISDIQIQGTTKTLTLETQPCTHFCPSCGFKMHSRGVKKRTVNHPIFQDNYSLVLILKQRRRFHVSDTYAHEVFDRYVKMDRLPLTDAISIDEVFLNMDEYCKYALLIQDFHTGDPIDLLRSRRVSVTEPYFVSIPPEERNAVKYLVSDMYNQYIAYVDKYFPNAVPVVDSFHVIQWLIRMIDNYIRQLLKKFRQRDRDEEEKLSFEAQHPVSLPPSKEVYLLQKYRWLILANQANIKYHSEPRMDSHFRCLMNTYDYEDALFRIDPKLKDFRDLKETYNQFNSRNAGKPLEARRELDELIPMYQHSEYDLFRDFGALLENYKDYIINSFVMVE